MKILWHSSAPWGASSYSVVTRRAIPRIVFDGHEVCVNSWYGLQGEPQKWSLRRDGDEKVVTILPSLSTSDTYGGDTIPHAARVYQADVVMTCMDVWVLNPNIMRGCNWVPWCPIDFDPCPKPIADSLQPAMHILSLSEWGARVLRDYGFESVSAVPPGASANVFKPLGDKKAIRRELGMPEDAFIVGMVAANKDPHDRKGFGEGLAGFAKFAEKHEDAWLYLHSFWKGPIDLTEMLVKLGLERRVGQPNQYALMSGMHTEQDMANIYNAMDVFLNPAKSEGFGLPILEAQMCGTPVALSDFSTTDELLFAGWRIAGQKDWGFGAASWRLRVYIDSVADALEAAYADRGNEKLSKEARKGAEAYDLDTVHEKYWRPALAEMEEMIFTPKGLIQLVNFDES